MRTIKGAICLALVVIFSLLGQFFLMSYKGWLSFGFFTLAVVILAVLAKHQPDFSLQVSNPGKSLLRVFSKLSILGLLMVVAASWLTFLPNDHLLTGILILFVWLAGVSLFSIGIAISNRWHPKIKPAFWEYVKNHRSEAAWVAAFVIVGTLIRVIGIGEFPYPVGNDETRITYEALRILKGEYHNFFIVICDSFPLLSFIPQTGVLALFGNTIFSARLLSAIQGGLTLFFFYLLAKDLFNKRIGITALALLTFLPVHIHFSRMGINNNLMGMHAVLVFWLIAKALRGGNPKVYLWAGLITGSALYAYSGSRLVIILSVFLLCTTCLFKKGFFRANWKNMLIFGLALLIVILPMLAFYARVPAETLGRWNEVSIFRNHWIERTAEASGKTPLAILWDQLVKVWGVFVREGEEYTFYGSLDSFFNVISAIFLILGIGSCSVKARNPLYLFLLIWFWSVVILGGAFTVPTPAGQRLIIAFPAASLLVALGMDGFISVFPKIKIKNFPMELLIYPILLITCTFHGLVSYFGNYRTGRYFLGPPEEIQIDSIQIEKELGKEYRYVLIGEPTAFLEFGNYLYLLDGYRKTEIPLNGDVLRILERTYQADNFDQRFKEGMRNKIPEATFFVAIPERLEELSRVVSTYPGGQKLVVYRMFLTHQVLFYGYIIPPVPLELPDRMRFTDDFTE